MNFITRHRSTIATFFGLTLLAAAFVYRWLPTGVGRSEVELVEDAPLAAMVEGSIVPSSIEEGPLPASAAEAKRTESLLPSRTLDAAARAEVEHLLAQAAAAEQAGRWVQPADDNAAGWYGAVLAIDPSDRAARAGRERALAKAIARIDEALDAGDLRAAAPLLAALEAFPETEAERQRLQARCEALPQIENLLREGARRMVQGQRFAPEGGSALDSYRAALSIDPRNRVARQGLDRVQEALTAAALEAAGNDRFDEADALMARAAELGADNPALREAEMRLAAFRGRRALSLADAARAALSARDVEAAANLVERAKGLAPGIPGLGELEARVADARTYGPYGPGERFADAFVARDETGPELVVMPLGSFWMGSPVRERGRRDHEGPRREVRITRPFAIARHEVTVREFRVFVEATGYVTTAERLGSSNIYDQRSGRMVERRGITWRNDYAGEPARDRDPVVHVSWTDAAAYAAWLAHATGKPYRLPSEAEFEYALRANTPTRFLWGDGYPETVIGNFAGLDDRSPTGRGWTSGFPNYADGHWGPAPVASFPANAFGVHDLDGNVAEWVEDCWHDSYLRAPDDASAWVNPGCSRRVIRGGSWGSAPEQLRSAHRNAAAPELRNGRTGFRVARDLR